MKSLIQKTKLHQLTEQRNGYLVLSGGLVILCLVLSVLCFSLMNREKIVLVPPQIERNFWVSGSQVSPEYLSEMTAFFAWLRLNMTADSADHQRDLLLRYTDPRYYGELKNALISEHDRIIAQHISMAFYPVNVKVDSKKLSAIITGDLISTIGNV
jgi:conjugal transfer pilus assembly protein TraE